MKNALLIVDFVYDFVADDGKLTCGACARAIDAAIAAHVGEAASAGGLVVSAQDCHPADDAFNPECRLFPPHCVTGTPGAELYGKTGERCRALPPGRFLRVPKTRYSAFAGTGLDMRLRERGITDVYLAGVCTDICVLHTAVAAYNLGYGLHVYEDSVASFNAEGHRFALAHFKQTLGAEIL